MKTFKGFLRSLKAKPVYLDRFTSRNDVFSEFQKEEDKDIVICYANYRYEDYDGSAMVIYWRKSTKNYYEVYGGHCSCYGLEGQWTGDEVVNLVELEKRLLQERIYGDGDSLKNAFEIYKKG